jgi:phage tail sheath protein FI
MVETDRADSLYIINAPNLPTSEEIVDEIDAASIDSNYSATYWPWIQVRDVDNATQIYLPPTGEVVKNIALTDNVSYPWFAVAGYSRGLVNSIKAFKKLTLDERDDLYKNRINPIATFSDTGTIIWGNKTLQVRESALDRINVRRLLLRARKLISAVAVRLIFEQNDEQVRNEFLRLVNPILDAIKRERGLFDFRVTVSSDPADIDANTLRGKIFIKPTRSLEFIDVEFIITPTGASFDNI